MTITHYIDRLLSRIFNAAIAIVLLFLFWVALNACAGGDADAPPSATPAQTSSATVIANAGPDQTVTIGQAATITGTLTPDNTPVCWGLTAKPSGSLATLSGSSPLIVTLSPDLPGQYVVSLGCADRFPELAQTYPYHDDMIVTAIAQAIVAPVPVTPVPPTQTIVTLHFQADGTPSVASGNFSYVLESVPSQMNVGGVQNRVFSLLTWHFDVQSTWLGAAPFSSDLPEHTGEVCVGICTFGSPAQVRVNLRDDAGHLLHFSFAIAESVTTLPILTQFEAFNQGVLRVENATPVTVFRAGTISDAPANAIVSCDTIVSQACKDGGAS